MSAEGTGSFVAHILAHGTRASAPAPYVGILADICDIAIGPSRELDAQIALALYPALLTLDEVECGVWLGPKGSPITAPRYSFCSTAAGSLVPDGCQLTSTAKRPIEIVSPHGGAPIGAGYHRDETLAILAAALRAHAASTQGGSSHPAVAKIRHGRIVRSFPSEAYRAARLFDFRVANDDDCEVGVGSPPSSPVPTGSSGKMAVALVLGLAGLILFALS